MKEEEKIDDKLTRYETFIDERLKKDLADYIKRREDVYEVLDK